MNMSQSQQVTCKGGSRGYILCVLCRTLEYVRKLHLLGSVVQFPFPDSEVLKWLDIARYDCVEPSFQDGLGGTPYDSNDPATFWTKSQQFCTW